MKSEPSHHSWIYRLHKYFPFHFTRQRTFWSIKHFQDGESSVPKLSSVGQFALERGGRRRRHCCPVRTRKSRESPAGLPLSARDAECVGFFLLPVAAAEPLSAPITPAGPRGWRCFLCAPPPPCWSPPQRHLSSGDALRAISGRRNHQGAVDWKKFEKRKERGREWHQINSPSPLRGSG